MMLRRAGHLAACSLTLLFVCRAGHSHHSHEDSGHGRWAWHSQGCALGDALDFQAIKELGRRCYGRGHHFAPPGGGADLCVPQKNGNRNWGGLFYFLHNGRAPSTVDDVVRSIGKFGPHGKDGQAYLIARNPYTRVLSQYLNHVAGECVRGSLGCDRGHSKQSFEEYVVSVKKKVDSSHGSGGAKAHPLCYVDHHLCPQVDTCDLPCQSRAPLQLKLERQPSWFECFMAHANLTWNELRGKEWQSFSGKPYYYQMPMTESNMYVGPAHGTNASGRVKEHYTPQAARIVTELYRDDLRLLRYPTWDGVALFREDFD